MSHLIDEELPDRYQHGKQEFRAELNMTVPYDLLHKLNTTSKDLQIHRNELIETLLKIGLTEFLDPKQNPANRPVKSAREILLALVRKVTRLEAADQSQSLPRPSPAGAQISRHGGVANDPRPVRPGDIPPEGMGAPDDGAEEFESEFAPYDE